MAEQKEAKVINVSKTVEYLNRVFQEACRGLPLAQVAGNFNAKAGKVVRWENPSDREVEGERHLQWQVDMAHMINDIQRSPGYFVPKIVADCNKLIEDVKAYRTQKSEKSSV